MRRSRLAAKAFAVAGLVAALGVSSAPAGAHTFRHRSNGTSFRVVTGHLNNPRGLSPAPGGGLYLAEAGAGGRVCVSGGQQGTTCIGRTGSFDWVNVGQHRVRRLVAGLISFSGKQGVAAEGPVSVSAVARGAFFGQFGLSSHAVPPAGAIPASLRRVALAQLGHLVLVSRSGLRDVSAVGDQDWLWTSTHKQLAPRDFPDANPNAVLSSGGHVYVVDAGANTLVGVNRDGSVRVLAFFPVPRGSRTDSVPTCVARGPDHALYVGELLGGSTAPGHARVWRVVPGHAPRVWARGLTAVQGCGFGTDGAFYATEFQVNGLNETATGNPAGDVVRIDRFGHRTHLGLGKLFYPSGFAPGPRGSIFVSNCSISPGRGMGPRLCRDGGQVVQLRGSHFSR